MKILIIGGSGFIGQRIVKNMRKDDPDWEITVLDDLRYGTENYKADKGIELLIWDIKSLQPNFIKDYDLIINLACVHLLDSGSYPIRDLWTNTEAVLSLLENMKQYPHIRYIHFSTGSVLPLRGNRTPKTHYSISKYAGELYTDLYMTKYNLDTSIIRPFGVYGPGGKNVVNIFLDQALNGKPYTIHGDGTQKIRPTYVDDVASITKELIESPTSGWFINTVGKETFSINELADHIDNIVGITNSRLYGDPPVSYDLVDIYSGGYLNDSLKYILEWKQPYTLDERLKQMVNNK